MARSSDDTRRASPRTACGARTLAPALALALALGAAGCGTKVAESGERVTFEVKKGDLVFARSFYGELVARKSIAIHTPELPGIYQLTVESVKADGTKVSKGDVVLVFSTGIIEGELSDLEAQLAVAKAEMRRLRSDLARERIELSLAVKRAKLGVERAKLDVIVGVNLISKLELQKFKIALRQARLALRLARKALVTFAGKRRSALEVQRLKVEAIEDKAKEKRQQIAAAKVKSPADGVLYAPYTRLNWVRGKVAPGSVTRPGDKILEIPDLSTFDVALYVRQRDASLLKRGDEAVVVPTVLPDQKIRAKVVSKEDFASTRNERLGLRESQGNLKEVKVLLRLSRNFPQLRPGGTVRADVTSLAAKNVTIVPLIALRQKGGVYKAKLASGKRVRVKVGRVTSTHAEVLSGLSAGDEVVLPRQQRMAGRRRGRGGRSGAAGRRGRGRRGRRGAGKAGGASRRRRGGGGASKRRRGGTRRRRGGGGGGGGH